MERKWINGIMYESVDGFVWNIVPRGGGWWNGRHEQVEEEKKEKVRVVEPVEVEVGGKKILLDGKGELWYGMRGCGGEGLRKRVGERRERVLKEVKEVQGVIDKEPDERFWRVPDGVLMVWADRMLECKGEVAGEWGRQLGIEVDGVVGMDSWMCVVPKQEATSASVDVKNWEPAVSRLLGAGYTRGGTIHTHPGGMTGHSGTDAKEGWMEWGGVHYVVARTRDVGVHFSLGGQVVMVKGERWQYSKLDWKSKEWFVGSKWERKARWKQVVKDVVESNPIVNEDGGEGIKEMVTEPVRMEFQQWENKWGGRGNVSQGVTGWEGTERTLEMSAGGWERRAGSPGFGHEQWELEWEKGRDRRSLTGIRSNLIEAIISVELGHELLDYRQTVDYRTFLTDPDEGVEEMWMEWTAGNEEKVKKINKETPVVMEMMKILIKSLAETKVLLRKMYEEGGAKCIQQ